jgi:hypothetical protein
MAARTFSEVLTQARLPGPRDREVERVLVLAFNDTTSRRTYAGSGAYFCAVATAANDKLSVNATTLPAIIAAGIARNRQSTLPSIRQLYRLKTEWRPATLKPRPPCLQNVSHRHRDRNRQSKAKPNPRQKKLIAANKHGAEIGIDAIAIELADANKRPTRTVLAG